MICLTAKTKTLMQGLKVDWLKHYLQENGLKAITTEEAGRAINEVSEAYVGLAKEIAEMRRLQKEYFKRKQRSVLIRSKEKERLLDEKVERIIAHYEQIQKDQQSPKLFP